MNNKLNNFTELYSRIIKKKKMFELEAVDSAIKV